MNFNTVKAEALHAAWLPDKEVTLNILRLDKIHAVISGNKWFKLKYYLRDAIAANKTTIATFGGAWSNHIAAVAFAAKEAGFQSVGIIRGEQPVLSDTLTNAMEWGMKLHFVSRQEYRDKSLIKQKFAQNVAYWIDEGGYGPIGVKGASEILDFVDLSDYTHIIASVGTGTMLAGLLLKTNDRQKVIGISSLKGNYSLENQIRALLPQQKAEASFQIIHDYHFGGFGKHPPRLIDFINEIHSFHQVPLDIVYTGKTLFAIKDLVQKNFFKPQSCLLMIHSGGLQGNRSLPPGTLLF